MAGGGGIEELLSLPDAPSPQGWADSLPDVTKFGWILDCYRLRIDDDASGGGLRGLAHPESTELVIAGDFLTFCKLAVQRGVLPADWDWAHFLAAAPAPLIGPFSHADAEDKYGCEDVLNGWKGGRSLRFTALLVYRRKPAAESSDSEAQIIAATAGDLFKDTALFADIGGVALWQQLLSEIAATRRDAAADDAEKNQFTAFMS